MIYLNFPVANKHFVSFFFFVLNYELAASSVLPWGSSFHILWALISFQWVKASFGRSAKADIKIQSL